MNAPRLKQKKTHTEHQKVFEKEDRIASSPILMTLMERAEASLQKTLEAYKMELQSSRLSPQQIQQLLDRRQLTASMTLKMLRNACDASKLPREHTKVFLKQPTPPNNEIVPDQLLEFEEINQSGLDFPLREESTTEQSSLQPIREEATWSEVVEECERKGLYYKVFRVQAYKQPIFEERHRELLSALVGHYYLLSCWLAAHRDSLSRVIRHYRVQWVPLDAPPLNAELWLQDYRRMLAITMERGETTPAFRSTIASSKLDRFSAISYLQRTGRGTLEYLCEVSEGLGELLRFDIYHMDLSRSNFIPVAGRFKWIDFQFALYLGQDPQLRASVHTIWRELSQHWQAPSKTIVSDVFNKILCRKCQFDPLNEVKLLPAADLYSLLLTAENDTPFVDYLRTYCRLYYRNYLLEVWMELRGQELPEQQQDIEDILGVTQIEEIAAALRATRR